MKNFAHQGLFAISAPLVPRTDFGQERGGGRCQ